MLVDLSRSAQLWAADLTAWRRHLHANPEISFEEHETTAWLKQRLEELGIAYTQPTPTGLVGLVEGNRPGRTVAVRADIDALPILEETGLPFQSTRPGAMHACGHDGHTAILLGLARFLSQNRQFSGRVKLLFQPAEEKPPGGARAFVEAGVLDDADACIGLHLISEIPTGQAAIKAGPMMACADRFTAVVRGRGGHGAEPHRTIDSVMVACHGVVNLQTIVSRKVSPLTPAVVTVGAITGGTTANVIADSAVMQGTVRSFEPELRQQLHDEIRRTLEATCAMYGATLGLDYTWGYPALVNHPEITGVLRTAAAETLGAAAVHEAGPIMGGEDFAYYAQKLPAAFIFVGCRNPAVGAEWAHHHPRFTIDEAALPYGLEVLGRATLKLLKG